MRLTYLAVLILMILATYQAKANDEVTFSDFSLYAGDSIEIDGYTIEMLEVQSIRDGIVVVRATKAGGALDEQRALLENSANSFDGGAEDGGLTVTIVDIFDENSAKVRIEYPKEMGTPRKSTSNRSLRGAESQPKLEVQKSFDKTSLGVGEDVKVTVSVKNVGGGRAEDISLEDAPPLANFAYIAGYPPKIKSQLDPGESDSAVYVISAVKEGNVNVPAINVKYSDSKSNTKSNSSSSFDIEIAPKSKPNLEITLMPPGSIPAGQKGRLNVSIFNSGKAPAYKVEVKSEVHPPQGLEIADLDKSFFEIDPGTEESYSAELSGSQSGKYSINVKVSYQSNDEAMFKEASTEVVVLEREYKYLYYLLTIPLLLIAAWIIKRYKEYKY